MMWRALQSRGARRLLSSSSVEYYPGVKLTAFTNEMAFQSARCDIPTYRVVDEDGKLLNASHNVQVDNGTLVEIYQGMNRLRVLDTIFYDIQRQGRISFYMTSTGEEGLQFGSAAALAPDDVVYGQYREPGVIMWRGFTLDQFASQCFAAHDDLGKGRQMPVHYGSAELHYHTISSPLATQIPQATGAAYAMKRDKQGRCVICYFGDGAASEGDFHPALNFAATLDCPVLFFCRNNGYAISTPIADQYRGDGVAPRAVGYGIEAVRVDGNDVLACYEVTKEARRRAVEENRPILIEAMSYRRGHHSTSDDSTAYRSAEEIQSWQEGDDPLRRLRMFLEERGLWDQDKEKSLLDTTRRQIIDAVKVAEAKKKPSIEELFTDVYADVPHHLQKQRAQLQQHLAKYPDVYNIDDVYQS